MFDKKFIVRDIAWGYSDEVYYESGHYLHKSFSTRKDAEAELRKLQIMQIREIPLSDTASLFDGSEQLHEKVKKYIEGCTGKELGDLMEYGAEIPDELNDEQVLELGKMLGTMVGDVLELREGNKLLVLWDPEEDEAICTHDECGTLMVFGVAEKELLEIADEALEYHLDEVFDGKGSLESLSDNPELLKSLIASTDGLEYNANEQQLVFGGSVDSDILMQLNALLKKPFYELKEMSVKEFNRAQAKING